MFARILWEKGRQWPFIADNARQGWRTMIGGRRDSS
jgi:hypothetical protein